MEDDIKRLRQLQKEEEERILQQRKNQNIKPQETVEEIEQIEEDSNERLSLGETVFTKIKPEETEYKPRVLKKELDEKLKIVNNSLEKGYITLETFNKIRKEALNEYSQKIAKIKKQNKYEKIEVTPKIEIFDEPGFNFMPFLIGAIGIGLVIIVGAIVFNTIKSEFENTTIQSAANATSGQLVNIINQNGGVINMIMFGIMLLLPLLVFKSLFDTSRF